MNRVRFEYLKATAMAVLALITMAAIAKGGGPQAYGAGMLLLPVVFALLTIFFCWKASVFRKEKESGS
ncbi:hypothetical protein [Flexivirga meconopsidis]|uniref:hypothetical protein n=1 Tax=Flexivirga meconopsidis TaxID=2977121 RepID=UPI00223EA6FC|nr:hypothetical protein [Flexivirga meconopsidis]